MDHECTEFRWTQVPVNTTLEFLTDNERKEFLWTQHWNSFMDHECTEFRWTKRWNSLGQWTHGVPVNTTLELLCGPWMQGSSGEHNTGIHYGQWTHGVPVNTTLELLTDSERTEFRCCVCMDLNRCWLASTAGRCCLNSEQCLKILTLPHGCTHFWYFIAQATKYFTGVPDIYCRCIFTR
jgi:hypothetical protein